MSKTVLAVIILGALVSVAGITIMWFRARARHQGGKEKEGAENGWDIV